MQRHYSVVKINDSILIVSDILVIKLYRFVCLVYSDVPYYYTDDVNHSNIFITTYAIN
jgi:hypothetical protein